MMRTRAPAELRAAGEARWFGPAVDRLAALGSDPNSRLRDWFSPAGPLFVARAPGRLDVMGGIADYSGALVLELPLERATWAAAQLQTAPRLDVATRRGDVWELASAPLDALLDGAQAGHWSSYVRGVVRECHRRAARPSGIRLLVDSTVPEGKGVSSSAALEVACMAAVAAAWGVAISAVEMAAACQWVENHVAGAPCGIMDQMTSACGRRDRLLRLRCQPGTVEGHVEVPAGYRFYGIDSGLRHAVSGADYGTVRTAAFMGYRMIADLAGLRAEPERDGRVRVDDPHWRGYLANLAPDEFASRFEPHLPERLLGADFLARFGGITDSTTRVRPERSYPVRAATAHPVREQARVERFATLLAELSRDASAEPALGRLMAEAHESYGACGLGSDGTDRLVQMVADAGPSRGLFGAKITGGGSGGTVAILGASDAEPAVREIAARYASETGREAEVFADSGPGAEELGVMRVEG